MTTEQAEMLIQLTRDLIAVNTSIYGLMLWTDILAITILVLAIMWGIIKSFARV